VWTFVQYHLPRADVPWTKLIPGAILVAVGVEVLQIVTVVWFTRYIENKSETYGAIGAALAILLWAYFLGRIVVSGAMLNAALYEQEHGGRP
jgi:membrane protein